MVLYNIYIYKTGAWLNVLRCCRHEITPLIPILDRHYGSITPIKPNNYV